MTTFNYDALGRVLNVTEADGSVLSRQYTGNCVTKWDEASKVRGECYDGLGRLTQLWEDQPGFNYATFYNYDALGNLTCVEQHGSASSGTGCSSAPSNDATSPWRIRRFTYDSLSRLLTASNPESGTITYTYDVNGNVATKTAPKPNQTGSATVSTTYSYDAINRPTQKSYNDGTTATVKYGYDGTTISGCTQPVLSDPNPKGYRTAMCDGSGSTAWSHDAMGRTVTKKEKIDTFNQATTYAYNLDGSVSTETYPTARVLSYGYNGAARPLSLTDTTGSINYVSACSTAPCYTPHGALQQARFGVTGTFAGITVQNNYNKRLQPILISATTPSPGTVLSLTYDFHLASGDNGNVFQIANGRDSNRTQNFFYDNLNRITQAYTNGNSPLSTSWGETFTIDAWGNLTNRSGVTGKTNYEGLNAAPSSIKNQLNGYCHDAAGNLGFNAPCPVPYNNPTYTYDAENRLITTVGYTYSYDGDGNRVKKTNGSIGTIYWRDASGEAINEANLAGTMQNEYVFLGGKLVARRDVPTGHKHYYFSDHLGSASVITSDLGVIQEESDYYPYGGEIAITNSDPNNYKFTGKERDAESGLDNFGARYDASSLGRFMTPDWAALPESVPYANFGDPQSLNLYSYVRNNPTSLYDPYGHCWTGFNWLCSTYQRFANLADGEGFRTNNQVDSTPSRSDPRSQRRRQQEVNGGHSGPYRAPQWLIDEAVREAKLNNRIERTIRGITEQCDLCMGTAISAAERGISLRIIHQEPPLQQSASYQAWSKKTTQEIIDSLQPGAEEPLTVYPDGSIAQGNSRITVLMERGVDVDSLPTILRIPEGIPDFPIE